MRGSGASCVICRALAKLLLVGLTVRGTLDRSALYFPILPKDAATVTVLFYTEKFE